MKRLCLVLLTASCFLVGCQIQPGVEDLPNDNIKTEETTQMAYSTVEKLAAQKHVKPSLSDDFFERYLDMDSFNELKVRTIAGIRATNNEAGLTKKEAKLWKDMIAEERLNTYTVEDIETKQKELQDALNKMAEDKKLTYVEFLRSYGLTDEEISEMIDIQSAKFVQPDAIVQAEIESLPKDESSNSVVTENKDNANTANETTNTDSTNNSNTSTTSESK